ncbi:hypothetical protein F4780DRAFT_741531 [Xylariomycetidae sp. FL0641]|nr:hypothetical protein F4780DRAFT_741531 [Xylariomycetidae sp. FL0641]
MKHMGWQLSLASGGRFPSLLDDIFRRGLLLLGKVFATEPTVPTTRYGSLAAELSVCLSGVVHGTNDLLAGFSPVKPAPAPPPPPTTTPPRQAFFFCRRIGLRLCVNPLRDPGHVPSHLAQVPIAYLPTCLPCPPLQPTTSTSRHQSRTVSQKGRVPAPGTRQPATSDGRWWRSGAWHGLATMMMLKCGSALFVPCPLMTDVSPPPASPPLPSPPPRTGRWPIARPTIAQPAPSQVGADRPGSGRGR